MSRNSYNQIFKSSVLTGGAQVVTMLGAFVRMKIAAVTIGAAGVGVLGLLNQSTGVVASLAGLGLSYSAIREVASAEGQGDPDKLARVIRSLRVLVWVTGLLGALICSGMASYLSRWTFGDETHATSFRILGAALFMTEMANGQVALLRGLGRIRELAIQGVVISLVSTVFTGAFYWIWGMDGIVPSLVVLSALTLTGSWWFARRVEYRRVAIGIGEIWIEAKGMLRLGVAFVLSAALTAFVAYFIGTMIRDRLGLQTNGFYQAAWGVSGVFVGIVMSAMGQDFYPRLTTVIHKPDEACRLINEQMEIGVLLALPGVVATVALARWLVPLLYSSDFLPAVDAVAWFGVGCYLRIIAFPFTYVLIAKGNSFMFALSEIILAMFNLMLALIGLYFGGLSGVAGAFAVLYFCYVLGMRALVGRMLGFKYTRSALVLSVSGVCLVVASTFTGPWIGLPLVAVTTVFCLHGILRRLGPENALVGKLCRLPLVGRLLQSGPR